MSGKFLLSETIRAGKQLKMHITISFQLPVSSNSYPNTKLIADNVSWIDMVSEPDNKCIYLEFRAHYTVNVKTLFGRKPASTYLLEENTAMIPFFMVLPRYVPYSETFKEKIDKMVASGTIQKWHAELWEIEKDLKSYVVEVEPLVLTGKSLKLGFWAYLIALAVSFNVFLIELAMKATKNWVTARMNA